jgi:hypothetical protein
MLVKSPGIGGISRLSMTLIGSPRAIREKILANGIQFENSSNFSLNSLPPAQFPLFFVGTEPGLRVYDIIINFSWNFDEGDFPQMLSAGPFMGGELRELKVRGFESQGSNSGSAFQSFNSKDNSAISHNSANHSKALTLLKNTKKFCVEINGPIMPHHTAGITAALAQNNENLIKVVFQNDKMTVGLNSASGASLKTSGNSSSNNISPTQGAGSLSLRTSGNGLLFLSSISILGKGVLKKLHIVPHNGENSNVFVFSPFFPIL